MRIFWSGNLHQGIGAADHAATGKIAGPRSAAAIGNLLTLGGRKRIEQNMRIFVYMGAARNPGMDRSALQRE